MVRSQLRVEIGKEHITWLDFAFGKAFLQALDGANHGAQMYRHMFCLRNNFALGIEDSCREVVTLFYVWRKGCSHQRHTHLLGCREHVPADDLRRHRIEPFTHPLSSK